MMAAFKIVFLVQSIEALQSQNSTEGPLQQNVRHHQTATLLEPTSLQSVNRSHRLNIATNKWLNTLVFVMLLIYFTHML